MKRVFILLICLMMAVSLFACGKKASPDETPDSSPSEFLEETLPDEQEFETLEQTEPSENGPEQTEPTEDTPKQTEQTETEPVETKPTATRPSTTKPTQPQAHTHDWKSEYQDATCNKEGYIRTKCSCGEIMSETKLPKTSHSWKNASCAAPKTCTNCGATEGSALSHSWMDATYDRPKTCRNCQATEGSALAAPTINVRDTFPKSYYYYSRSFTVSNCQASFGADSLGARYIRLSMDVSRDTDNTPTAGKLALKVNIYDSQNKLVQQDSIWSDDLSAGASCTMTASIPIPKASQSDSYTISFEESY